MIREIIRNDAKKLALPTIRSYLEDRGQDIRYCVVAYRKLSQAELAQYVPAAVAEMEESARPRRGGLHQIISMEGSACGRGRGRGGGGRRGAGGGTGNRESRRGR